MYYGVDESLPEGFVNPSQTAEMLALGFKDKCI